jgi:hypothetical protein
MTEAAALRLPADVQSTLVNRAYCCGTETRCRTCQCLCRVAWWDFENEAHESGCSVGVMIDEVLGGRQLRLEGI